jgi:hypothetical protein
VKIQQDIKDVVETIKRERDELRVQLHLFKAEAHDEWVRLEKQWAHFRQKADTVATVTGQATGDVGVSVRLLGDEIAEGYRKIRDSLKSA